MEYAVTQWLKQQISGATLAGLTPEVHIMPAPAAPQETTSAPRVYIWPNNTDGYRKEMGGFYWYEYRPMWFLLRQTVTADETSMETFLAVGDALRKFLSGLFRQTYPNVAPGNAPILDPETGDGSYLQMRDERVSIRHRLPRGINANLPVTLEATLAAVLYEQNVL